MKKIHLPRIGKLRLSVNKLCNLNCLYCHEEGQFGKRKNRMSFKEIKEIVKILKRYGIDEIKIAYKEPLLYKKTPDLLKYFKSIGIPKTSLTTNGTLIKKYIKRLEQSYLDELSISLATINPKTFEKLCGTRKQLEEILTGVEVASRSKIKEVNLNMVLTSYNVGEIDDMIKFASEYNLTLRLIAFIKLNPHDSKLVTRLDEVVKKINSLAERKERKRTFRQVYTEYKIRGNKIILVDSVCPDCEACGRDYAIRLTLEGKMKPCLISEKGELDILTPYRHRNFDLLNDRIQKAILIKKFGLVKYFDIPAKKFITGFYSQESSNCET